MTDRTAIPAPPARRLEGLCDPALRGGTFHLAAGAALLAAGGLATGACFLPDIADGMLVHLCYLPVLLAAFLYGWRGALPAALLTGLATGTALRLQGLPPEGSGLAMALLPHVAMLAITGAAAGAVATLLRGSGRLLPTRARQHASPVEAGVPDAAAADAATAGIAARRFRPQGQAFAAEDRSRVADAAPALLHDLAQALRTGQGLWLAYQPKVDLRDGSCIGAEALVRWEHARLGPVAPDRFVPLCETTPLIRELTRWVLCTALDQLHAWRQAGLDLTLSVNVSARNLVQADFAAFVEAELAARCLPAGRLELEVTESALMIEPQACIATLQALRALGVQIASDDFGTGQSSMAYLRDLPADTLKIDRSFIDEIDTDRSDEVIVRATILIARFLRMRVVAEGVENDRVYEKLRRFRCDQCQGFHIARPLSAPDFLRWLQTARAGGAAAGI